MKKQIIASTLAAAVALTSFTAAPARANDEVLKIIAIGTAIYLVGTALNDAQKQQAHASTSRPRTHHRKKRHVRKILPDRCEVHVWHRGKYRDFYKRRCTENNVRRPDLLPQACLTRVYFPRGWRSAYRAGCLRRHGWVG